jgi:putative spermidine/putrescine transport system ATP-binding protein
MDVFNKLVRSNELIGNDVAIRPEVLKIVALGDDRMDLQRNWGIKGIIKDVTMTGNVLRYEVETEESSFLVDHLNHRGEMFQQGAHVNIIVPKEECVIL